MDGIYRLLLYALPFLFSLSFHEASHAWMANRLGDPTAKQLGRLTLNPLAHIDWIWTVILPAITLLIGGVFFGAAKPVPFDPRNLSNPQKDSAMIALAGPVSNLLLSVIFAILMAIVIKLADILHTDSLLILVKMLQAGVIINLFLAFFNFIPLAPLDGSKIIRLFLNYRQSIALDRLAPYSMLIILVLWQIGFLSYLVAWPAFTINKILMHIVVWLVH